MKDLQHVINQLQSQKIVICALVSGLSEDEVRWKPDPEAWSVLEVLNHLVDEEIYDFRTHLDHILHRPGQPWPSIDPVGWVSDHRYHEQDLQDTLTRFDTERERSLTWLTALSSPDWNAAVTQSWGTLSAGDMLASWLAHDLLHMRQLVELCYQITQKASQPYHLDYAGKW